MRLDVTPRTAELVAGSPVHLTVTLTNTATVIGGYTLRVLGADPGWVDLEADQVSLFPEESRTVALVLTPPPGLPSGVRRIAVQAREMTPPHDTAVIEVDLAVAEAPSVQVRLDPPSVTAGRTGSFSVLIENRGNTVVRGALAGDDPESRVAFRFDPGRVVLAPGEHAVVDLRASARRRLLGTPAVRVLGVFLDDVSRDDFFTHQDDAGTPVRNERDAVATGTLVQRSVLSRGALSLVGLLAAITVFALVITFALSKLVDQSAADRNLALQVAAARDGNGSGGTAALSGTVRLLSTGKPVSGISVGVYSASQVAVPVATTATDDAGRYRVQNLAAGPYKISFRGAGFVQLWYPGAATDADATTVTLTGGQQRTGLDVTLGGVPATISGTVQGDDVAAATLYLQTLGTGPGTGLAATAAPGSVTAAPATQAPGAGPRVARTVPLPTPAGPPDTGGAVVATIAIGSDGRFTLTDVPSPSVYELVVVKTGFATSQQRIDVGAGENRTDIKIGLTRGDGLISGVVGSATGPLDGVTITATAGQSTASTVSLTDPTPGAFTLRQLPTPATVTLVASKDGFASQTITLTLGPGQKVTGVALTLGRSSGELSGVVSLLPGRTPGAGVAVTVTDGLLTVQTTTQSAGGTYPVGSWRVTGLPIPGTYTVTFSRRDLASQTASVSLDAAGNPTPGSLGATITEAGIAIDMSSATAVVSGRVTQDGGDTICDAATAALGEATVTLNSGSTTYQVTTASVPASDCGRYRVEGVPPGTYTLTASAGSATSPKSQVITIGAGDSVRRDIALPRPASLSGCVLATATTCAAAATADRRGGWTVTLYLAAQYPSQSTAVVTAAADGGFTFPAVPAGKYIVEAGPTPGNPATSRAVVIQPSEQADVVLVAAP